MYGTKNGTPRRLKCVGSCPQGIANSAIRRIARRGGAEYISGVIYEDARKLLKAFIQNVFQEAITNCVREARKTTDIVEALKKTRFR